MTTQALPTTAMAYEQEYAEAPSQTDRWGQFRSSLGLILIVVWGLAPFYWMIVTSFRNVGFTFDTTPWPTHVTLDNFRTAFSTDRGNHFGAALVNSLTTGVPTPALAEPPRAAAASARPPSPATRPPSRRWQARRAPALRTRELPHRHPALAPRPQDARRGPLVPVCPGQVTSYQTVRAHTCKFRPSPADPGG